MLFRILQSTAFPYMTSAVALSFLHRVLNFSASELSSDMLKTDVLSGRTKINIIDMDTIDV